MNKSSLKIIFVSCLVVATTNSWANTTKTQGPHHPFPQFESMPHYTLADGTTAIYPSASPTNRNTAVKNYYNQWKTNYLTDGPTYNGHVTSRIRLSKKGSNASVTVSEGQAYGMIITVMMAGFDPQAHETFDKLYHYVEAYPSTINPDLMSWKIHANNAPGRVNDSAFDGDADIALALILAANQWGNSGTINYMGEANIIINAIKVSTIGLDSHLPLLGDWVNDNKKHHKHNFSNKECTEQGTKDQWTPRTSDFMLDNFHTFSLVNPSQKTFWDAVTNSTHLTIDHLQTQYSSNAGLLPDFTQYGSSINTIQPSGPCFLEAEEDGEYSHNASRTPWRIGIDALLNNDTRSLAEARKMSTWIMSHTNANIESLYAGYKLNGEPLVDYNSSAYTAPFGVAAMLGGSAQQTWLNNIYNNVKVFDNQHEDYYEHTLSMLSLLIMTGNYWSPATFNKK